MPNLEATTFGSIMWFSAAQVRCFGSDLATNCQMSLYCSVVAVKLWSRRLMKREAGVVPERWQFNWGPDICDAAAWVAASAAPKTAKHESSQHKHTHTFMQHEDKKTASWHTHTHKHTNTQSWKTKSMRHSLLCVDQHSPLPGHEPPLLLPPHTHTHSKFRS